MARKTLWVAGNVNFPHKWVFSKELFRISFQSLQIFKVFGSLKFKGTVMQIEKAQINDHLPISKVSGEFRIPTICNFAVIYL